MEQLFTKFQFWILVMNSITPENFVRAYLRDVFLALFQSLTRVLPSAILEPKPLFFKNKPLIVIDS